MPAASLLVSRDNLAIPFDLLFSVNAFLFTQPHSVHLWLREHIYLSLNYLQNSKDVKIRISSDVSQFWRKRTSIPLKAICIQMSVFLSLTLTESSPKMAKHFRSLNDILAKLLRDLDIEHKVNQSQAIVMWPKIVGKRIAEVSTPERVANGVLYIRVSSAVWRSELVFMKYKILHRFESELGKGIVKDIRFL